MEIFEEIFIHDDLFPTLESDNDFDTYKQSHPEFDPEYILQHCYAPRQETKVWLESIWKSYQGYAEPRFLDCLRSSGGFHNFSWQMYLGSVLLEKKYQLVKNNGKGPDIQIVVGGKNIWVEAIVTTPGNDKTAEGIPQSGSIYSGLDPRVARISNALTKKHKKYKEKYLGTICRDNDPYVIAINGSATTTLHDCRAAEATVYGRGNDVIKRLPDGSMKGGFYELRESFVKIKNGKEIVIPANYFCNDSHKEISGILYCERHIINANNFDRTPEDGLYLLLNPYAINKINIDEFRIGNLITMSKDRQIKYELIQRR